MCAVVEDGFWLFSLLVENLFEDDYVGLHLQNDLLVWLCLLCGVSS